MKKSLSKDVQFKEGKGKIHGFTTGTVSVKSRFKKAKGGALLSKINFLLDKNFTPYMPIWVWVIEHPEGVFVVDTGENARVSEEGYFKKEGPVLNFINTRSFKFDVKPEEEVGPQLAKLGFKQEDIKKVIMTHMHLDHFDGLHYFDQTDILVNRYEWEHPSFALPSLYPEWFEPQLLDLKHDKQLPFERSLSITSAGDVQFVTTPGHTRGHCSVLVQTEEMDYFLAGDTTYDQHQLQHDIKAGGHQDFRLADKTFKAIKTYAQKHRMVYLPSHDPRALERLEGEEFFNKNSITIKKLQRS